MKCREYVIDVLELKPFQNVFCHGVNNKNSLFGSEHFNSKVLAIRLCAEQL